MEILFCTENNTENFTNSKSILEIPSIRLPIGSSEENKFAVLSSLKREKAVLPLANPYIALYLIIIVLAAVISNSLVLTVMSRRKKLHSFQICLISICISDLLFSLLLHPMSIATALGYNAEKIFNHSGCLYFGVLALFFGSFDMVIHSVIAVIRYTNVCHFTRIEFLTKRTVFVLIIICVLYSAIWCIGPVFGIGKYVTFEVGCTMDFADDSLTGRTFVNCAFIFIFFIPLTIMILSYIAIVVQASKQRKLLIEMGTITLRTNRLNVELKLVRLTSVIATAYIIVWLPYAIVCLSDAYGDAKSIPWTFKILAALFCKTGTATNPVIYLFMSKGFRQETAVTMKTFLKYKKEDSMLLYNSSQKTSSYRSCSQFSSESPWLCRIKKERNVLSKLITNSNHEHESSTYIETFV